MCDRIFRNVYAGSDQSRSRIPAHVITLIFNTIYH